MHGIENLQPSLNVNDIASCQIPCQKDIVAVIVRLQLLHDSNENADWWSEMKKATQNSAKLTTPINQTTNLNDEAAGNFKLFRFASYNHGSTGRKTKTTTCLPCIGK